MHLEAEVHLPIVADLYWKLRNSEDYLAIECKHLNNASKKCMSEDLDKDSRVVLQHLATKPDLSVVPPLLLRMLPGDEGLVFYDEVEFSFDDQITPYAFTCRTTPSVFGDKAEIVGHVRVVPSADGLSCTQMVCMDVKISQWGVGGVVENLVVKGIKDAYSRLPDIVREWQEIRAQAQQTEGTSLQPRLYGSDNSTAPKKQIHPPRPHQIRV